MFFQAFWHRRATHRYIPSRQSQFAQSASGALAPSGTLSRVVQKAALGALAPTGALDSQRTYVSAPSGAIAPSGTLTRQVSKSVAGSVSPAGAKGVSVLKAVAGALASIAGSLAGAITKLQSTSGSLAPVGTIARLISKFLPEDLGQIGDGEVEPTGSVSRRTSKIVAGAVAPAGSLARRTSRGLTGGVEPSGALATQSVLVAAVSGVLALAGTLTRSVRKVISGVLSTFGALAPGELALIASGTLEMSGSLTAAHVRPPVRPERGFRRRAHRKGYRL